MPFLLQKILRTYVTASVLSIICTKSSVDLDIYIVRSYMERSYQSFCTIYTWKSCTRVKLFLKHRESFSKKTLNFSVKHRETKKLYSVAWYWKLNINILCTLCSSYIRMNSLQFVFLNCSNIFPNMWKYTHTKNTTGRTILFWQEFDEKTRQMAHVTRILFFNTREKKG